MCNHPIVLLCFELRRLLSVVNVELTCLIFASMRMVRIINIQEETRKESLFIPKIQKRPILYYLWIGLIVLYICLIHCIAVHDKLLENKTKFTINLFVTTKFNDLLIHVSRCKLDLYRERSRRFWSGAGGKDVIQNFSSIK